MDLSFRITNKTYLDGSDFNSNLIAVTQIHGHLQLLGIRISGAWSGVDVPLAKRNKLDLVDSSQLTGIPVAWKKHL
jgi:hypothetical protein